MSEAENTPSKDELDEDLSNEEAAEGGEAQDALVQAEQEIEKLKDQILRAMAETENTRRRMKKEIEDAQKFAVSSFAKEILTIADNFARAMEAMPQGEQTDKNVKNLLMGVQAIERQLAGAFEKFGIHKIDDPVGKPYDPHFHQVMMEQDDPNKPAGMVMQVLQQGYMIQDRLLREAMVVVAKGGPVTQKVDTQA